MKRLPAMSRELYVYYRVPASNADALRSVVTDMHRQLRHEVPGLQARLLRRTDPGAALDTWLETYAMRPVASAPSDGGTGGVSRTCGVSEALRHTIEQRAAAWAGLCDGARHTEVFDACA